MFLGLFRLVRFELPFAAGVTVVVGEMLALGRFPNFEQLALGFLGIFGPLCLDPGIERCFRP